MKDIKVERFKDTMLISDEINAFLEENDAEYVDMKYIGELGVLLVYREKENKLERKPYEKYSDDNIIGIDNVDSYDSLVDFINETCIVDRNVAVKDRIKLQDFKNEYSTWCYTHFRPEVKINHEVIEKVFYPRFGTKIVKNSTNYLSNLKWIGGI